MHTREPRDVDPLIDMGYERRDIDYRALFKWVIGFFVVSVGFFVASYFFYWWHYLKNPDVQTATAQHRQLPAAPNPRLQTNTSTKTDIMKIRQDETARLAGTGWVNREKGIVHIPIDRAIELTAQGKGIRSQAVVPAVSQGNTTDQRPVAEAPVTP
jgi:hypothetical protein